MADVIETGGATRPPRPARRGMLPFPGKRLGARACPVQDLAERSAQQLLQESYAADPNWSSKGEGS